MPNFFTEIKKDISKIEEFIAYYNNEYEEASKETLISGNVVEQSKQLPHLMTYRFTQLQEIEAVLKYFEILRDEAISKAFQKYSNGSMKLLSATEKKYYIQGDADVIAFENFVNSVAFLRNKFISITKGFDCKNYAMSNIIKLKVAGVEDWEV